MNKVRDKKMLFLGVACLSLVFMAYLAQMYLKASPCIYCVMIRFTLSLCGIFAIIASLISGKSALLPKFTSLLLLASSFGLSVKLAYDTATNQFSCMFDSVSMVYYEYIEPQVILLDNAKSGLLADLFLATASCEDAAKHKLLGLINYPNASLIGISLMVLLYAALSLSYKYKSK